MLSVEMVYAVRILRELEVRKNTDKKNHGAMRKEIFGESPIGLKIIRRVFSSLNRNKYIEHKGGRYISRTDLNEITLYDLLLVIYDHQICLGENLPGELKGDYLYNPEYEKLRKAEARIEAVLVSELKKIRLADYVFGSSQYQE